MNTTKIILAILVLTLASVAARTRTEYAIKAAHIGPFALAVSCLDGSVPSATVEYGVLVVSCR